MTEAHDIIVVGGGVFGCAVAYQLARRSAKVLLIDKTLPGKASSASAGGLWPIGEAVGLGCGVIFHATHHGNGNSHEQAAGPEPLPTVFRDFLVASNARFPELALELRERSGVDIEYQPGKGLLFLAYQEREIAFIRQVAPSVPGEAGLEMLTPAEARRVEPQLTGDLLMAAYLPDEHQVNPMSLCEAFKRAALRSGAKFVHETEVTGLRRRGDRVVGVEAGERFYAGRTVINAAGAWAGRLAATAHLELPVVPVRGQIVLTQRLPATLATCLSTAACYLAQKAHGEVLIGSTTEHAGFDVSVTPEAIHSLCRGAVRAVPALQHVQLKRTWSGLRPGTPDEMPLLGPVEGLEGYLNAAGGFRTGIVASPLAGEIVAQYAAGETTTVPIEPFLADRFTGVDQAAHSDAPRPA